MPLETDYEFGKRAVSAGHLKQDQLEECVEILVALERVGSKQRLWQVIQRKAYMNESAIAEVRASVEVASPAARPAAPKAHAAPKVPAGLKETAGAEETAEDLHLPSGTVRGFVLAHVHKGGQTKLYPLPPREVTLGKGSGCDIVLSDAGVLDPHARLNCHSNVWTIQEGVAGRGVVVNDQPVRAHKLGPYDLIELGSALLLFLPDCGEQPATEPVDMAAAGGAARARVRIVEGARKGLEFFLGARPLTIGRHPLANVRLRESAVAGFQAHIARTPQGTRLVDLLSAAGTKINGVRVNRQLLNEGDNISMGPVTLEYHLIAPADAGKTDPQTAPVIGPEPAAGESAPEWDIAAEVEVEAADDPFMRRGTKEMPREAGAARTPLKAFKPGDLRLMCVEGPLEGKRFIIATVPMVIGRDKGLGLTIPDGSVSRRHAEIVIGAAATQVKDLGSRNGIFVNGARVTSAFIRPGDTIRIHKSLFLVEEIPPRPAPRKP